MEEIVKLLFAEKPYLAARVVPILTDNIAYNQIFKINNASYTLIHLAALRDSKILKKMLSFKPKLDQLIDVPPTIHNPCSSVFVTPLMLAILSGKIENAKLLINAGADINQVCRTSGHTAASLAICCQKWQLAEELLDLGGTYELQERKGDFSILERITQLPSTPESLKKKIFSRHSFSALRGLYPSKEYEQFVWRIIPAQLFKDLQAKENLIEVLALSGKKIKSIVFNKVFKPSHLNFSYLSFYYILKDLNFNYDLFCSLLGEIKIANYYSWNEGEIDYIQHSLKYLKTVYSEKQVITLLKNSYKDPDADLNLFNGFWQDIFFMCYRLEQDEKSLKNYLPKKPKNITKIHDYLAFLLAKEEQDNYPLHQEDLEKVLSGSKFKDFKIYIPKNNHDLVGLGLEMHICVGNGVYGQKIVKKDSEILVLNGQTETYCVEIDARHREILDAKANFNEEMPKDLRQELQSFLNCRLWWPGREGT